MAWLLDMPLARQLEAFNLRGSQLTANALALFGETDASSGLETLVLDNTGMNDEMARRLSEVTTFCRLQRLSLADNYRLGPAGIAAILQAEFVPRLDALCLDGDGFDDGLVQLLVESPLSATVHLSIRRRCEFVVRDAIVKRFPNWSYNDRFIERKL